MFPFHRLFRFLLLTKHFEHALAAVSDTGRTRLQDTFRGEEHFFLEMHTLSYLKKRTPDDLVLDAGGENMTRSHNTARCGQARRSSAFWALRSQPAFRGGEAKSQETSQGRRRRDSFSGTAWTESPGPRPRSVGLSCKPAQCDELCFLRETSRRSGVTGSPGVLGSARGHLFSFAEMTEG